MARGEQLFHYPRSKDYQKRDNLSDECLDWSYTKLESFLTTGGVALKSQGIIDVMGDVSMLLPDDLQELLLNKGVLSISVSDLAKRSRLECKNKARSGHEHALIVKSSLLDGLYHRCGPRNKISFLWKREKRRYEDMSILHEFARNIILAEFLESGIEPPKDSSGIATKMLVQASHRGSLKRSIQKVRKVHAAVGRSEKKERMGKVHPIVVKERVSPYAHLLPIEVAHRAQAGDKEAIGVLYSMYSDKIYRYMYNRTGESELAKDLVAEVFISVIDKLHTWSGESFTGWLYKIAFNKLIDDRKKRARRPIFSLDTGDEEVDNRLVDEGGINSEHKLDVELSIPVLLANIDKLPEDYQFVLYMRFVEELQHEDIGRRMGKSEVATKVLFHRALRKLREQMIRNGSSKKVIIP